MGGGRAAGKIVYRSLREKKKENMVHMEKREVGESPKLKKTLKGLLDDPGISRRRVEKWEPLKDKR